MDEMISYEEAARMLGLARGTLYSMVCRRQIPHVRLGPRLVRFSRAELTEHLEKHKVLIEDEPPKEKGSK